jgi:hypothetical protein
LHSDGSATLDGRQLDGRAREGASMFERNIEGISALAGIAPLFILALGCAETPAATPREEGAAPRVEARTPLDALGTFLDGVHKRDGHEREQMETVHYCGKRGSDMFQCALFDGRGEDARLVGVEYVISERAMQMLPDSERALWHSHAYEVRSGQLVAPDLTPEEEHALMAVMVNTYGKTWHTWQHDHNGAVPIGRPSLMMSITRDGEVLPGLVEGRDAALGVSTRELRMRRADIANPSLVSGVDRGEGGMSCVGPETGAEEGP